MTGPLLLALASTLGLAAMHLLAPWSRRQSLVSEPALVSFAGGLAVSYVFLHLIPELARGNRRLRELFGEQGSPSPLLEIAIFLVALAGFLVFYGLERLARHTGAPGPEPQQPERFAPNRAVFRLHLGSFLAYNGLITYSLPLTYRTGVAYAALFTVAMGLHFVVSDRGLQVHYGTLFDQWRPRLLLAGALVAGWLLAWLFAPTRVITVSVLTAFLAGGVLLNVFKEEIPSDRRSSFPWFVAGLASYGVLLVAVTVLGGAAEGSRGGGG